MRARTAAGTGAGPRLVYRRSRLAAIASREGPEQLDPGFADRRVPVAAVRAAEIRAVADRLRSDGLGPMDVAIRLLEVRGAMDAAELRHGGVSARYLRLLVRCGLVARVGRGRYAPVRAAPRPDAAEH